MSPGLWALVALLGTGLLPAPVSASTLYTWRDPGGTLVFTDNPKGAPPNVEVRVWPERHISPPQPASSSSEVIASASSPGNFSVVTQGEFAVHLVEELGLWERPNASEAKDILTRARIAPRLGDWNLDQPMTPDLTMRLRRLTVASAEQDWIPLAPNEGLLAFDTTAALLGVPIPNEGGDRDAESDASDTAIDDTPPLVFVATPPAEFYPYYSWRPLRKSYRQKDVLISGVYVLDLDRYSAHHGRYRYQRGYHRRGQQEMSPERPSHRGRTRSIGPDSKPPQAGHHYSGTLPSHNKAIRNVALPENRAGVPAKRASRVGHLAVDSANNSHRGASPRRAIPVGR